MARILTHTGRFFLLFALCFGAWLLFSMDTQAPALLVGAALAVLTTAFSYAFFFSPHSHKARRVLPRMHLLAMYVVIILVQSYISSLTLIYRMLTGRYNPRVVRIRTRLRSSLGQVLLANTISMIPGTLSMWMDDRHIYVHCFDIPTTHSVDAGRRIKQSLEDLLLRVFG